MLCHSTQLHNSNKYENKEIDNDKHNCPLQCIELINLNVILYHFTNTQSVHATTLKKMWMKLMVFLEVIFKVSFYTFQSLQDKYYVLKNLKETKIIHLKTTFFVTVNICSQIFLV